MFSCDIITPMKKSAFWIILLVLLLAAAGFVGYSVLSQIGEDVDEAVKNKARNAMPLDKDLLVHFVEGGSSRLSWTGADHADGYRVEILDDERHGRQIVFKQEVTETECELPVMPRDREFTVRINSFVKYFIGEEENIRYGDQALERQVQFRIPAISGLEPVPDPNNKTLHVTFTLENADACVISHEAGEGYSEKSRVQRTDFTIPFGEDGYPVPAPGEIFVLLFEAEKTDVEGKVRLYGYSNTRVELTRDDLLSGSIELTMTKEEGSTYRLTWSEAKGDSYRVQVREGQTWKDISTVDWNGDRSYDTGALKARSNYVYRVITVNDLSESTLAVSNEVTVTTSESPIHCTVWPNKALTVYSDAALSRPTGAQAPAGKAFCVLDETGNAFKIRVGDDTYGYIDSRYCLINVDEYLGSMCRYDIANSYSAIYMIHEFEIPGITGRVMTGYENVMQENGHFLVPLLYPTSRKLAAASRKAESQGYMLKLYDTFRPNKTTLTLYSAAEAILGNRVPDRTYKSPNFYEERGLSFSLPPARYHGTDVTEDPAPQTFVSYEDVMTDNRYTLNYFLAKGYSKHNYGVAMDLTLEKVGTGEEMTMQTRMHDLSAYAARDRNGTNANALSNIMTSSGFETLVSEWWHFNDMEAYNGLYVSVMYEGVSAECWMADEEGWRYRTSKGAYYKSCTAVIDGKTYSFDDRGYIVK